jgi:phosphoglycerol transferase MdoB-like AlkP superfamily enzyme
MHTRARESGITIIGFIFVAAVVLSIAMIGFRVLPSYIEYFSVEKTLKQTLNNARDGMTLAEFRRDFDLKASADYIDSVRGTDVELSRDGNTLVATATWSKTLPLVGNASILLDFQASASK